MTGRATELLRHALELPREERAAVATELIASLDDNATDDIEGVETLWAHEITRRARRVLSGDSAGTPWEEVHRTIEGNLGKR